MKKRILTILVINISLLSLLLGGCSKNVTPAGQTIEVKRGDLDIVVSADGSLAAPDKFDLVFGTTGRVIGVPVVEGEMVREGALLAMIDSSSKINDIKTALFGIQTAQNNITVQSTTNNASQGCDHIPYNYPDLTVSRMADEAKKDMDLAVNYFKQGNYKDAGYNLIMTYFDIEVCEDLITSKPDAAVLAGAKTNSTYYPDLTAGSSPDESPNNAMVVDYLQKYRQKLLNISGDMKSEDVAYEKIAPEFDAAQQEMFTVSQLAKSTVYRKGSEMFEYPDTATSVDFLQSSLRSLQELEKYLSQDNPELSEVIHDLYTAKLNLQVGRDVLENQTSLFVIGKGLEWQKLQKYNLGLQSKEIALYKAKQAIMKTAIIAPIDGMVVSVNLKSEDVLSNEDFSSKIAVELVNIKHIKFTGTVDEIDIMKVKPGQKASITVDAVPDKVFTGTVKFISPFGTKSGNVVKFAVTIELDPTDVELRGGLSATANINVYSAKNVLLVPISAIVTTPSGSFVTVINEATGQSERRKVTLGAQNFQFAEVLSGLKEGDKIKVTTQGGASSVNITQTRQGASNPGRFLR